jgi:CRISPR-associated endoribonuclease Cas6
MILSVVIELRSQSNSPILGTLGRAAQGWFLQQVTALDARLASRLHAREYRAAKVIRPYTVSTLLDRRGKPLEKGAWLQPGQPYWLRLTTLSEELSEFVLARLLPRLPASIEIYKMPFQVEGASTDPAQHPWAQKSSYLELHEQSARLPAERQIRLQFASPTAFRAHGLDLPLPLPGLVVGAYLERWNLFGPESLRLHEDFAVFAGQWLAVSRLSNLNTQRWTFGEGTRGVATGFTGEVEFTLQRPEKTGAWAEVWEGAPEVLHLLAAYSFFCGTGHHTTVGMGQTRSIVR